MAASDALHPQLFSGYGRPQERSASVEPPPAAPRERELRAGMEGPVQLPMFMQAEHLLGSLTATADQSYTDTDTVMNRKLRKSKAPPGSGHGAGVHASVAKEGVLNPVQMIHAEGGDLMMGQGHHRVAAAAEIERRTEKPKWVPVVHTDAREESELPLNVHSEDYDKRAVIADYRKWSENTTAIGQDLGWKHREETANERAKKKIEKKIAKKHREEPLPSRYRDMESM